MPQNRLLTDALNAAGWSPRELVRQVNAQLQAGQHPRLDLSAGYAWIRGAQPRQPVPTIVAEILTHATGTTYSPEQLWPGIPASDRGHHSAVDGLLGPWSTSSTLALTRDLTLTTPTTRAALAPTAGTTLITAALDGLAAPAPAAVLGRGRDRVDPPLVDLVEARLADLRRLDDQIGGGPLSQRYVHAELTGVVDLIRHARYTTAIAGRLLRAASGLAQLAAWLAFDGGQPGAAQRHHLLAIRLARAAGDDVGAANSLGMLAYQLAAASARGAPADAVRLAEAAIAATRHAVPTARARAHGRLATAHAAAGDLHAYRHAAETARTLLDRRRPEDDPPSLYYLTPEQLAAESGHALLHLALTSPAHARGLLRDAIAALTPLATGSRFARSALLHGCHLAHAHLRAGELEATALVATGLAQRVPAIHSTRCRTLLAGVRTGLARRSTNPWAADATAALDRALSAT